MCTVIGNLWAIHSAGRSILLGYIHCTYEEYQKPFFNHLSVTPPVRSCQGIRIRRIYDCYLPTSRNSFNIPLIKLMWSNTNKQTKIKKQSNKKENKTCTF